MASWTWLLQIKSNKRAKAAYQRALPPKSSNKPKLSRAVLSFTCLAVKVITSTMNDDFWRVMGSEDDSFLVYNIDTHIHFDVVKYDGMIFPACALAVDDAACATIHGKSAAKALQNFGGGKLSIDDVPIIWSFEACGAIGAFTDVSSWKMRERKLNARIAEAERANLAKPRIRTEVSHDLRQPVQSLISLIAVIRRQLCRQA